MKSPASPAGGNILVEVIGDPIAQSKSPLIHGHWLRALGLLGTYRATLVPPDRLAVCLSDRRADPAWRGCNVTIPHKQAVIPLLDRLDPVAGRIGAVNTIVREGRHLVGYNTDAAGFLAPLRPRLAERHLLRTARIVGAGGAARAIAHALWDEGFTLIVYARDEGRARDLLAPFDAAHTHVAPLESLAAPLAFDWGEPGDRLDLFVNASPLGMAGQPPLDIDISHLPPGAIVYDAVYAPLETRLLAATRAAGHPVIDGLAMLVGQARLAFRLLFGADPPDDDPAVRARLTA